jgi:hypothetical protein
VRTIINEQSGDIPADISNEASEARVHRKQTRCESVAILDEWTHFTIATLAEQCSRLATVEGADSEFARSLSEQYAKTGSLSAKQVQWANRLYRRYSELNRWQCESAKQHDWHNVGSVTHHYNTVLGTYSATDYHKCSKCGEWSETTHINAYSGD